MAASHEVEPVYGWELTEEGDQYIYAEHHTVLKTKNGALVCVMEGNPIDKNNITFVPDNRFIPDLTRPRAQLKASCLLLPLNDKPEVAEVIRLYKEFHRVTDSLYEAGVRAKKGLAASMQLMGAQSIQQKAARELHDAKEALARLGSC